MAMTFDPRTGQVTTTFLLRMEAEERRRRAELDRLDREILDDACKWRCLPARVRRELEARYFPE